MKNSMLRAAPQRDSCSISYKTFVLILITALWLLWTNQCSAQAIAERLNSIKTPYGRDQLGILLEDESGKTIYSVNPDKALKPASVLKIFTTAAALENLGPAYHFETCVYEDKPKESSASNLYVKGGGDPGFAIEDMYLLARKLWNRGVREIGTVLLDDSLFGDERTAEGQRAYQTGSSALSFNYNSVGFEVCPTSIGRAALVTADPWELGVQVRGNVKTIASNQGQAEISEINQRGAELV